MRWVKAGGAAELARSLAFTLTLTESMGARVKAGGAAELALSLALALILTAAMRAMGEGKRRGGAGPSPRPSPDPNGIDECDG